MTKKKIMILLSAGIMSLSTCMFAFASEKGIFEKSESVAATEENVLNDNVLVARGQEDDLQGKNYLKVTRASGEIEIYEIDNLLEEGISVVATEGNVSDENVLVPQTNFVAISPEANKDESGRAIQPRATSHSFDWTINGNTITYSTTQFKLYAGDSIDFAIATTAGCSCRVGLYDNSQKEFHSSGYYGGTEAGSFSGGFSTTVDFSSASFAIKNERNVSNTFTGLYTLP